MSPSNINLITPDPHLHLQSIAQLAADAFAEGQYVEQFAQNYIGNSHYDWHTSRLVFDNETLVHHWGVWGYQMRLESIQLKVAGIGAVVTHPDYRK
jgi:predicted acetyltransferase